VPWSRVTCCRSDSIHFYLFSEGAAHSGESKLHSMDYGRLIRAGRYRRDPHAVAYIVAMADAAAAIDLIRNSVTGPGHEIEDIGRVSDALLQALHIRPGEFARADPPHMRSAPPLPAAVVR
jgi:hypothetical protein